jgi:asparagine synthase (glutamine-hydrolysing)
MTDLVNSMLTKIAHRGKAGRAIVETDHATIGIVWSAVQADAEQRLREQHIASDEAGPGHRAAAEDSPKGLVLARDELGVAPLYYGLGKNQSLCFASEVKALRIATTDMHELPPGNRLIGGNLHQYFALRRQPVVSDDPTSIAKHLRKVLEEAVTDSITDEVAGSWLSGGLDSSTMAALARPRVKKLHTFAAGFPGAPDLEFAKEVAAFIKSDHHEAIVSLEVLLDALPTVIYHLESFDALLVRSSLTNYLVAKLAAEYVPTVFSGEGGDEFFAGYEYLKSLPAEVLPDELIDIANRLHNTALQRVDRSASAHGTVAHIGFTHPRVVDFALRIPSEFKLRGGVEKWILRRAMEGALPERVLNRTKAKFWEGAGVGDLLAQHANRSITDDDFRRERSLPGGWSLNTKEELLYYRAFQEHFGGLDDLTWMGRTKGAPKDEDQ